jgi:ABC-type glutathione transport system ATPase component
LTPPLLRATDVSVAFGRGADRVRAVRGVSLVVEPGESVGIVGESGSGKSTLARVLVGLQRPDEGTVELRGRSVFEGEGAYPGALRRQVQMVFQDPYTSLNPRMSALDAVAESVAFHDRCTRSQARDRALALLGDMGIPPGDAVKKPRLLSGGQRQRVSVARALAAGPSVLVADEPTSAIDQSAQAQLLNLFNRLLRDGLAIVLISHNLAVIRYLSRRVHVMRDGEVVEEGETERIFGAPSHDYTRTLIASIPGREAAGTEVSPQPTTRDGNADRRIDLQAL